MEGSRVLPPRKTLTPNKITKQYITPLQTLLQMGFHRNRAEKALAATGDRGAQLAADWLLAHINDPVLDTPSPREYILYACPTGEFYDQLQAFWEVSLTQCGRNGAHNYIPHITLVPFFKAPDECSLQLAQTMQQVVKIELENKDYCTDIYLEPYISQNFMGFFVPEEKSTILKQIATQFVKDVSNTIINDNYEQLDAIATCFPWCANATSRFPFLPKNVQSILLEPHVKSLHLALAYQFASSEFEQLKRLVETEFDLDQPIVWEIRLYSRDTRVSGKHVYKVLYSHVPHESDELELRIGDFVYISDDAVMNSPDGWVEGTSWLTGCSGFFPINYTERTAETDAWTLHRSEPLFQDHDATTTLSHVLDTQRTKEVFSDELILHDSTGIGDTLIQEPSSNVQEQIQIYIMRHGERVDFTFGNWVPHCFTKTGKYIRKDLNMPLTVPMRDNYPQSFVNDCPLTNLGIFEANLTGKALTTSGVSISHVFCSPALRCVQTCDSVLKGLGIKETLPICIDPAIFEWLNWYQSGIPEWLTSAEYETAGYNIDTTYKPFLTRDELEKLINETCEQYYDRNFKFVQNALQYAKEKGGGNILIVGHAASLDTCSRQLCGYDPRNAKQLDALMFKIPYCSLTRVHQEVSEWKLVECPIPCVSNSVNKRFNWKILIQE